MKKFKFDKKAWLAEVGYFRDTMPTGLKCWTLEDIWFRCSVCKEDYMHYLLSERMWKTLPPKAQKLYLCQSCFAAIRYADKKLN